MPLVLQELLSRYGFRITLRALAVAMLVLMIPLPFVCKPRLPVAAASTTRRIDVGFFKSPVFWVLQTFNVVQGMGYFLPSNYLPTYAQSLGISSRLSSLTLVLVNVAGMCGCVMVGALVDRMEITTVVLGVSVGAAISIFVLWGVSTSLSLLCVFAVLYGLTAGSYSTAWAGMIKDVQRKSTTADASVIFSFLAAGRGVGATISGPLSESLIADGAALLGKADFGYGSKYSTLIIFSGCTALVGGFSWIVRRTGLI
jgi:predicted MFS family arabinose efflux permease